MAAERGNKDAYENYFNTVKNKCGEDKAIEWIMPFISNNKLWAMSFLGSYYLDNYYSQTVDQSSVQKGICLLHRAVINGSNKSRQKLMFETTNRIVKNNMIYEDLGLILHYVRNPQKYLSSIISQFYEYDNEEQDQYKNYLKHFVYEYGLDWREYCTVSHEVVNKMAFPIVLKQHAQLCHIYKYIIDSHFWPLDILNVVGSYIPWFYLVDQEMKKNKKRKCNNIDDKDGNIKSDDKDIKSGDKNIKSDDKDGSNNIIIKRIKISNYVDAFIDLVTNTNVDALDKC